MCHHFKSIALIICLAVCSGAVHRTPVNEISQEIIGGVTQDITGDFPVTGPRRHPDVIRAIAHIRGRRGINGVVEFEQIDGGPVRARGYINGLPPGHHGLHIHIYGDLGNNCEAAGPHYNPTGERHGGLNTPQRHIGDFGNIFADSTGFARVGFTDSVVPLAGPFSIIGRALVVHENPDNLGQGLDHESGETGHSGGRLGCGVVGIAKANLQ